MKKIKMKHVALSARNGLLPPFAVLVLKKIAKQLVGVLILGLALLFCLLLATYNSGDLSFNTITHENSSNFLSVPGSYVADLFMQFFGMAAFLWTVPFILLGVFLAFGFKFSYSYARLGCLILSFLMVTTALGLYPNNTQWLISPSLGGACGYLMVSYLKTLMPSWCVWILGLALTGLSILAYLHALGLYSIIRKGIAWKKSLQLTKKEASRATENLTHADSDRTTGGQNPSVYHFSFFKRLFGFKKSSRENEESPDNFLTPPGFTNFNRTSDPYFSEFSIHDTKEHDQSDGFFNEEEGPLPEPRINHHDLKETDEEFQKIDRESSLFSLKNFIKPLQKKPEDKKQASPAFAPSLPEDYELPSIDLLDDHRTKNPIKKMSLDSLEQSALQLKEVLQEFGVRGDIVQVTPGPVVTLYELKPAAGIKTSRVIGLADDIARSMSALSARIAVVPGRNVIGIELPNPLRETVYLRDLLLTEAYLNTTCHLPLILGKDIGGAPIIADMARMPHVLVAGTTGSGKSVAINTMIMSILFKLSPEKCRFIMVDPKMLELSIYDGIPHLLTPVVTDPKKAIVALKWAVKEMENRYRSMAKLGVRNIDGYNMRIDEARSSGEMLIRRVQTGFDPDSGKPVFENQSLDVQSLPYIIIVVDEMADLMLVAGKEIEAAVQRLAQMARAAGIHLIMATQRPSVDVITGTIKANFPTRISFQVSSKIDSRTILGEQGAEQLLGQGDMLYMAGGGRVMRVHGPFVRDDEVEHVVNFLKAQGEPTYEESIMVDEEETATGDGDGKNSADPLYEQAVELVQREGKASTSFVQRYLQIGYNRAARIIEQMEKDGHISPANHVGKREVLR